MTLDISEALVHPAEGFGFDAQGTVAPIRMHKEDIAFQEPVKLAGTCTAFEERVVLEGSLTAVAEGRCARCLARASLPMTVPFREVFLAEPDPQSPDCFLYDGKILQLDEMVHTLLVLALPMRMLCGAKCQGICPDCGANNNETPCDCRQSDRENPFAALQQLSLEDEEE